MDESRINNSWPVAKEGIPFILISFMITILFVCLALSVLSIIMGILTAFIIYFFRDPGRRATHTSNAIICPADGKILRIDHLNENQSPLNEPGIKISIFMSIFDVHVNRIPADGKIEGIVYRAGKYFSANLDKASEENEKNSIFLKTPNDKSILLVQIAGLIARRIVCWIKAGDMVEAGQRFGLIRFGSRVEIFLPHDTTIEVKPGQKVKAGITMIGYLK